MYENYTVICMSFFLRILKSFAILNQPILKFSLISFAFLRQFFLVWVRKMHTCLTTTLNLSDREKVKHQFGWQIIICVFKSAVLSKWRISNRTHRAEAIYFQFTRSPAIHSNKSHTLWIPLFSWKILYSTMYFDPNVCEQSPYKYIDRIDLYKLSTL